MALAGHAMLVQVSAQIERLQGTVEQVLIKMDAARLGKVDAVLVFLSHAHHYRPEHQVPTLLHAAQTLSDVLGEALRDVAQGIGAVPEPQEWNLTRAVWDTTGRTAEALDRAAASMRAALMCLTVLWQVHLRLNDKDDAAGVIKDWLRRMLALPLAQAEFLARRLQEGGPTRPVLDRRTARSRPRASRRSRTCPIPTGPWSCSSRRPARRSPTRQRFRHPVLHPRRVSRQLCFPSVPIRHEDVVDRT